MSQTSISVNQLNGFIGFLYAFENRREIHTEVAEDAADKWLVGGVLLK